MKDPIKRKGYSLEVGQILGYSWGYGQTNVDWFQVVRATAKSVWIRPIRGNLIEDGFMCGTTTPIKDDFLDDSPPRRKSIQTRYYEDGSPVLSMDFGLAVPWDGRPKYQSWYH